MKFCKDCKHCRVINGEYLCYREPYADKVTGHTIGASCKRERIPKSLGISTCGPHGDFYERRKGLLATLADWIFL